MLGAESALSVMVSICGGDSKEMELTDEKISRLMRTDGARACQTSALNPWTLVQVIWFDSIISGRCLPHLLHTGTEGKVQSIAPHSCCCWGWTFDTLFLVLKESSKYTQVTSAIGDARIGKPARSCPSHPSIISASPLLVLRGPQGP